MTNIDGLPAECPDCGEWICECLPPKVIGFADDGSEGLPPGFGFRQGRRAGNCDALLDDMARAYRDRFEGFLKSVPIGWTITTDATVDLGTNTATITCTARPPQPAGNG